MNLIEKLPISFGNKTGTSIALFQVKPFPENMLHLCFDWDSTVASDEGDQIIANHGRAVFSEHEFHHRHEPHLPGPLHACFLWAINHPSIQVSIITARTGAESFRVMSSLADWGTHPDAIIFAGKQSKGKIASAIGVDLLFDDIRKHIEDANEHGINAAWVNHGNAVE